MKTMNDHQEETLEIIGIVRRWKDDQSLSLYMPEVSGSVVEPWLIDSYGNGGHGAASWSVALQLTEKVDYDDPQVKDFVEHYERSNNVKLKLRSRNQYQVSINV